MTWAWWKDVGERAIRTFAATLVGLLTVAGTDIGLENVNWVRMLSVSALSAVITVLMSISTHGITKNGPSFTSVYKDKEGKS